ncbi:hypothetical protein E3N88_31840 [Mikania micrantha]|uniref:Uncharacterized protein n=1 Tax=Mikania micrantha TaxID=192012 RepID=A0A5N6M7Z9_9ASTR|nr:hypothetical protein E3N88_31840 [Mikania micrantha]
MIDTTLVERNREILLRLPESFFLFVFKDFFTKSPKQLFRINRVLAIPFCWVWEFNRGGEHGERMAGSDLSQDKGREEEKEELRGAFVMYASTGGRVITLTGLKKMMSRLGQSATGSYCKVMIGKFDINRRGAGFRLV